MANYSVDLFPFYLMIIFGILGLTAVFIYILYLVLKFLIQRRKSDGNEINNKESKKPIDSNN